MRSTPSWPQPATTPPLAQLVEDVFVDLDRRVPQPTEAGRRLAIKIVSIDIVTRMKQDLGELPASLGSVRNTPASLTELAARSPPPVVDDSSLGIARAGRRSWRPAFFHMGRSGICPPRMSQIHAAMLPSVINVLSVSR